MELIVKRFNELTLDELYDIFKIRLAVFVVEQDCIYQDADDKDQHALHIYMKDEDGIQAYLRVMDKGVSHDEVSIGRVISLKRRTGLGSKIVEEGIKAAVKFFGAEQIKIEAQAYVRALYEQMGFRQCSDEFMEDGIPHIEMILELN